MQIRNAGGFIVLAEIIHFDMPWRFVFICPHVGETQSTGIAVVKVCSRFSTPIGTRHKAPVWGNQRLPAWLDITGACPDGAILEFTGGLVQADAAFVAGVVFIIGTVFGGERDFIRVAAGAGFGQLNGGKGSHIQTEHVPGIARGKIQAQVGGRV
ncbi:hypothetical protein D3C81_1543600 [compost metagenome]